MGDEEDRRELSDGLKEGELLSPCSTDRELGLSSSACTNSDEDKQTEYALRWTAYSCSCVSCALLPFCF